MLDTGDYIKFAGKIWFIQDWCVCDEYEEPTGEANIISENGDDELVECESLEQEAEQVYPHETWQKGMRVKVKSWKQELFKTTVGIVREVRDTRMIVELGQQQLSFRYHWVDKLPRRELPDWF